MQDSGKGLLGGEEERMQGLGREGRRHCGEEGLMAVRLCLGVLHSLLLHL